MTGLHAIDRGGEIGIGKDGGIAQTQNNFPSQPRAWGLKAKSGCDPKYQTASSLAAGSETCVMLPEQSCC